MLLKYFMTIPWKSNFLKEETPFIPQQESVLGKHSD